MASAPKDPKARGTRCIRDEIQRLANNGLYALPVSVSWDEDKSKKKGDFPHSYAHIKTPEAWERSINPMMKEKRDATGLAILAGVSRVYVVDIDVVAKDEKRPGIELWEQLVRIHGEPETLKARTGSHGLHLYFKLDSPHLTWKQNFSGVKVDKQTFGIDGRGLGGVIFAPPTSYLKAHGELATYEWINGPPSYEACQEMPFWLAKLVNNHAGQPAITSEGGKETTDRISGASAEASQPGGAKSPTFEITGTISDTYSPHGKELLLEELSKMLKKAGDSTSTYASSLSHGLYGTYYCYRTYGPRRCFLGHQHSGSNNFNLLKRGRNVYYRCHGVDCSHKPPKKLGVLENLKAALQDATTEPVDPHDDMHTITQYTRGSQEVQDLLLRIVVEHAAPEAYANLGRLFAYLYMIEGRILVTTNEADSKSRGPLFYVWSGTSWVHDTFNLVAGVFTSQMGCLLAWYERQRERCLGTLYASRSELEGFVVGGVFKRLDREEVNPKQMKKIKMATEACTKELDKIMPSFGKINVQDPSDVRKCMQSVVTELRVEGLLDQFDQDRAVANAPNGLIDLRTGKLLPHHPHNLCNNQTSEYISGASTWPTARFRSFLMEVLPPEAIDWLQMFLGYCLTGETSEELFVIANGLSGANGKGVLKQALRKAFGSYNCAGNKAIFIKPTFKANASAASTHLMQIRTKRFVTNDESEGVEELHASFVKEASGGGAADTLDFCVQGATMYYAKKALAPALKVLSPVPQEFSAAAKEYTEENDKACMTEGAGLSVAKSDFVEAFTNFLYAGGHDVKLAGDGLARAMCLKGFSQKPPGGGNNPMIRTLDGRKRGRGFFGIRLKTEEELKQTDAQGKVRKGT
ncbi:hypothetical protein KFL_010060020 [Klebsormidium nitens]|uniref:DNA primase/polymerase bifunctional N-terminal domain-containing protein n=1 Tax=Klebsormidium nitens TaxID=105231 RepID=A0A1Y1IVU6_KLENI|nr:hypothetical protein KFL_010060020 [Klebsormidium nitens]|eukprot:GAQ92398.1 hypothetical protein KFL_010060020 [Klebsormidium nitens]